MTMTEAMMMAAITGHLNGGETLISMGTLHSSARAQIPSHLSDLGRNSLAV